jgi:hypothetical protein
LSPALAIFSPLIVSLAECFSRKSSGEGQFGAPKKAVPA